MLNIIQIIPAPDGLQAAYTDDNGNQCSTPVICLALVVSKDTKIITPMTKLNFTGPVAGCAYEGQLEFYDGIKFKEF